MENLRKYGRDPFETAIIHGGPGAAGEMASVAKELSGHSGMLEPFQTKTSINGQIKELKAVLQKNANLPVILIGFSWGSWLSFIFAAKYPKMIKKLILVSSGPFEEKYADKILKTRLKRLGNNEKKEIEKITAMLNENKTKNKNSLLKRFGKLFSKADAYLQVKEKPIKMYCDFNIFKKVWTQAASLRKNGKLLKFAEKIKCPVTAIHGNYDPHPCEGVKKPLSKTLKNFKFILLKNCGHKPWIEQYAKEKFYRILGKELRQS
jgi:pimeloyl-ACP methyl ester carboxylesterase